MGAAPDVEPPYSPSRRIRRGLSGAPRRPMRSSTSTCRSAIGPVRFANVAEARGERIVFGPLATQHIADEFDENFIPKLQVVIETRSADRPSERPVAPHRTRSPSCRIEVRGIAAVDSSLQVNTPRCCLYLVAGIGRCIGIDKVGTDIDQDRNERHCLIPAHPSLGNPPGELPCVWVDDRDPLGAKGSVRQRCSSCYRRLVSGLRTVVVDPFGCVVHRFPRP